MTITQADAQPIPATDPSQTEERFNWRSCWYPIAFVCDLPENRPYGFSIYGEPFVLFRDGAGEWVCLDDRCPHRAAKLSEGQLINGRLECLYHGWQFGQAGECLHIPQLESAAKIPQRACAKAFPVVEHQGMIWVWADESGNEERSQRATIDDFDQPGVQVIDTMTDLPFDHPLLFENMLDPAHVYISHDRTELHIRREDAQPLAMEVVSISAKGFEGKYRTALLPQSPWVSVNFIAPSLVHYRFSNPAFGFFGGLALYALPIDYGNTRILVRRYSNRFKKSFTLKPRWLEHLRQNKILEEDLPFIVSQQRHFERTGQSVKTAYFPLKTADVFVMEHRKWLDRFGETLPWYEGYTTAKSPKSEMRSTEIPDRFTRHTQQCGACRQAYQRIQQIKFAAMIGAIAVLSIALISEGWLRIGLAIALILMAIIVGITTKLQTHFEQSFHRF